MRTAVIIPAYREAAHIADVVRGVLRHTDELVVVDDGSLDDTAEVARAAGAEVISHETNHGKGRALMTGFDWIEANGFDGAICLDADGQHDPDEIPSFRDALEREKPDVIVGNRMGDTRQMPRHRRLSNRLASAAVSILARHRIRDPQSGYRYVSLRSWREVACDTSGFERESEFLIEAARSGFKIIEIPIATIYGDETSKIHPVRETVRFIRLALRYL